MLKRPSQRGMTVVELLIVLVIAGILGSLAVPAFVRMVANAQVRGVADGLQNGLRLAQSEASRRERITVFYRSSSAACSLTAPASPSGGYWLIRVLPMRVGEDVQLAQCGSVGDVGSPVTVGGPTAVCFSAEGRQAAVSAADVGLGSVACTIAGAHQFDVSNSRSDRPLRIRVTSGGSVRSCDPAKTYSTAAPDGCPA